MGVDIKLLGYVAAILFFFMSIMLLLTSRQAGRVRGATQWLWSTLTIAFGIALNTSQEVMPPFIGLVVSNVLLFAGALMSARGTFEYRYHRVLPVTWLYVLLTVAGLILTYVVVISPNMIARVVVVGIMISSTCFWHAWTMLAGSALRANSRGVKHARFRLPHGIMVFSLVVIAIVFLVRTGDVVQAGQNTMPPGGPVRTAFVFYAIATMSRVLLIMGMMLVLIDELDHALRALASRDALTGLYNRRGLQEAVAKQALAHSCLLMIDLDHFKTVNDEFGHEQGDRVIALLARCAQAHLPTNALLARLGGDEFCAVLPGTDLVAAAHAADALRAAFQREAASLGPERRHTVSVGVAAAGAMASLATLLERADQALYRAKRNGRNRIETAPGA